MPRNEIKDDRADLFLIDVLQTFVSDGPNLNCVISMILGIDALASRDYCKEVLEKNHLSKKCKQSVGTPFTVLQQFTSIGHRCHRHLIGKSGSLRGC